MVLTITSIVIFTCLRLQTVGG